MKKVKFFESFFKSAFVFKKSTVFFLLQNFYSLKINIKMNETCNDLLLEIFSYLPLKEKIRCSQTCHRWRFLFQYASIYSIKIIKRQDTIYQLDEINQHHKFKCNHNLHKVNKLNVIYYDNFEQLNAIIQHLLPQLKRLKALHFEVDSLFELVEANLDSIIDLELEHFEVIYTCNMYIEGKIEKLLPKLGIKLKHLVIEPKQFTGSPFTCSVLNNNHLTSYFGRVGLELVSLHCPNLEILSFEPLTYVIESLHPIRLPTKLKTLALPRVRLSVTELFSMNSSNLTELHFFDINIQLFKIICSMRNLKILKLSKIRINEENDLRFLANLKQLEHLQFKLHYKIIDKVLLELMQQLTKIRRLTLINCCISNSTIKEITNLLPKLEFLELHNRLNQCYLTDECLDYLAGLDTLKSLALPYSTFSNKSLCNFIDQSNVRQLDVSNVANLNEDVFHRMVNKALKRPDLKFNLVILGHKFYMKENLCKNLLCVLD